MTIFTKRARDVFAPTTAAGVPRGAVMGEAQIWGIEVERSINAAIAAGALVYGTKAQIDADLAHGPNTGAWVVADATPANNGIYRKNGGSGVGSWTRVAGLPTGQPGDNAWSPVLAIVNDGGRRVQRVVNWTGGEGDMPAVGQYVGPYGFVAAIGDAVDLRGPTGLSGPGTGDLLAAQNLGDLDDPDEAITNLFGASRSVKLANRISREIDLHDYAENDPATVGEVNDMWDRFVADINATPRPIALHLPNTYLEADRSMAIPTSYGVEVGADSNYGSRIFCAPGTYTDNALFVAADADPLAHFRFHRGLIHCQGNVGYAFKLEYLIHSKFSDTEVLGATAWAMRLNGYCNTIENPSFHDGDGGGLDASGVDVIGGRGNSKTKVISGMAYRLGGIGWKMCDGWGMSLIATGAEGCGITGILSYNTDALYIGAGSYAERNGVTGLALADGATTITPHADILFLSGGAVLTRTADKGVRGAKIETMSFTPYGSYDVPEPGLSQDCLLFATSLEDLTWSNNRVRGEAAKIVAAIGFYNNGTRTLMKRVVIEQTDRVDMIPIGAGNTSFALSSAHEVSNRFADPENYASQAVSGWDVIGGSTGTIADSGLKLGKHTLWTVTGGDRIHGKTLDLTDDELAHLVGRSKHFTIRYRVLSGTPAVMLYLGGHNNQDGSVTEGVTAAGEYREASVYRRIAGGTTSLTYALHVTGGSIQFYCPVLAEVGNDLQRAIGFTQP